MLVNRKMENDIFCEETKIDWLKVVLHGLPGSLGICLDDFLVDDRSEGQIQRGDDVEVSADVETMGMVKSKLLVEEMAGLLLLDSYLISFPQAFRSSFTVTKLHASDRIPQAVITQFDHNVTLGFLRPVEDANAESLFNEGQVKSAKSQAVWMSHEDEVVTLPERFSIVAMTLPNAVAIIENPVKRFYDFLP
ncbi:hypothetical protein SUGI_0375340 [Cryptomeria japonica]|nr:hypothetical protein SUGI_0375340 [Cryptomeria japonica]